MKTYGPRTVTSARQVSLPEELLKEIRLIPGAEVYFALNDSEPGTVVLIPETLHSVWIDKGRSGRKSR
jgi:hypothetical protein